MKSRFELRFLGPVQIERDGEPVRGFESRKALALLAYLAVEGQPVPRERLVDLFWQDKTEAQGRNNLSWVLSRLSTFLPDCLQVDRHTVRFLGESAEAAYWLDLGAFEELETQGDPASLAMVVELYRGDFGEGLSLKGCPDFELWQVREQERWRRRAADALTQLVVHHRRQGEVEQGLRFARRLLVLEPWREGAHREVMRLLALDGQRGAALAQYETCRRTLAEELGLEPSEATERLYGQIRDGELELPAVVPKPEVQPPPPAPGEPPFKGLAFFDVADADLFFGREALTARLVQRVRASVEDETGGRFLAVVGTSGSGKSSLVRAGLVAALQRGVPQAGGTRPPEGSHLWPVAIFTPTANPLESLAVGLTRDIESVSATAMLIDDLARDPRSLHLHARRTLSSYPAGRRLLLVVDQFEELFTQCRDPVQRRAFIDNLLTAAGGGEGPTVVVITLRADFYHRCAQFETLRQALEDHQIYIGPMTREELRRAIEEPARAGGWDLEPGLVDLLLRDVGREPGALPLLSHTLLETWKRRQGRTLTLHGYTDAGAVHGAIAKTAEAVYQQLDARQQAIARDIFLRLTELGEGSGDGGSVLFTRRRAALDELFPRPEDAGAVEAVLKILADARLITTERETVQVAHEALIRAWPALREWLEESRSDVRMQRLLAAAAGEWAGSGGERSYLLRGTRLAQFEGWAEGTVVALTQDELAYLDASLEERRQRHAAERARQERERGLERRARRVLRGLVAVFLAAAVISGGLAIWANGQRRRAEAAEQDALVQASIGLASRAMLELEGSYPERSVLLALEALENYPYTWQAERALGQAVLGSKLRLLLQHVSAVNSAEWSADGSRILSVTDVVAKVWDASAPLDTGANPSSATYGEELVTLSGHEDWVVMATWSPSEEHILTASTDGTAKVWDASASSATYGECLLTLTGHADPVGTAVWSPTGELVVGADWGGTVLVWDVAAALDKGLEPSAGATAEPLFNLSGHSDAVVWAAWSPDGSRIVTASDDGTARVWDVSASSPTRGQELLTLSGHTDRVEWAAWSPDGSRVVTASYDDTVRVWDVWAALTAGASTGVEILTFASPGVELIPYSEESRSAAPRAAWSPTGDRIATGSGDATAQVWDVSASSPTYGERLLTLEGHTERIQHLAWSPDGSRIATASMDGTARIWDASASSPTYGEELVTLFGHAAPVVKAAWSPVGDRILTAGYDGAVKVWDPDPALLTLSGLEDAEGCLVWSRGGVQVAMGLYDGRAKVWDVSAALNAGANTGEERLLLVNPDRALGVCPQAWSPSGDHLLTTSMGGASGDPEVRARVWDAASGEALVALVGHSGDVWWAEWSPDGTRIVTGGAADDTARVWDASASSPTYGDELLTFADHHGGVTNVAWSPDGKTIATSSFDATAKIWDAATGQVIRDLYPEGHKMPVSAVSWSPDGDRIASFTYDGMGRIWDATTGEELVTLTGQAHEVWKMRWSRSAERIFTYGRDPTIRVWDAVTGAELLRYDLEGYAEADLSPDETRIAVNFAPSGLLKVFPAWQTLEELTDYARACCVVRELTQAERDMLGLPAR
jgi:WD40 repeat protein/DNA-binding SARP family transcriptional activator